MTPGRRDVGTPGTIRALDGALAILAALLFLAERLWATRRRGAGRVATGRGGGGPAMTGAPPQEARTRLAAILRAARLRAMFIALALALPLALAATALGWRFGGASVAVAAAASLILCLVLAWRRARMHDARWLSRRLNAAMPALEDSVALVLEDSAGAALDRPRRALAGPTFTRPRRVHARDSSGCNSAASRSGLHRRGCRICVPRGRAARWPPHGSARSS